MSIQPDVLIVRFGELSTKGRNRKDFVSVLRQNIQTICKDFPTTRVQQGYDRIFVKIGSEDGFAIMHRLQDVFGIATISLAYKVTNDLDDIVSAALQLIEKEPASTFKVVTRRLNKQFPYISDEINRAVAKPILDQTNKKVDIRNPEIVVLVEVRHHETYVTVNTVQGAHGLPVRIQGKALMLLSGGLDSPVAAYLANKRGIECEYVHFESSPYTSVQSMQKVLDLVRILTRFQPEIKLHIVSFTAVQDAIIQQVPESYRITVMRRMMMRISEQIAIQNKCKALITGDCIGQVASQTLESIAVISEAVSLPILRPLVTYDKLEIISLAQKIKTYDISIRPYEDCCTIFIPADPVTKPILAKTQRFEIGLDTQALINQCIQDEKTLIYQHQSHQTEDNYF